MSGYNVSFAGNIAKINDLRHVGKDKTAVINFTVAHATRRRTPDGNWEDGNSTFQRCTMWGYDAENFHESFSVGDRVVLFGTLKTDDDYTDRDGETRRGGTTVTVEEIGASVKYATLEITKTKSKGGKGKPAKKQSRAQSRQATPPADDFDGDDDLFDDDF